VEWAIQIAARKETDGNAHEKELDTKAETNLSPGTARVFLLNRAKQKQTYVQYLKRLAANILLINRYGMSDEHSTALPLGMFNWWFDLGTQTYLSKFERMNWDLLILCQILKTSSWHKMHFKYTGRPTLISTMSP